MPLLQAELLARLVAALPPATANLGQLVLLNDVRTAFSFTSANVNAGTGILTVAGHDFLSTGLGTRIQFPTAAPGGLTLNQDYWVRTVSGSNFGISDTPGGAALTTFSSAGSGTMTLTDMPLSATDQALATPGGNNAQWIRKAIATPRLTLATPALASYVVTLAAGIARAQVSLAAVIDNSAGGASLTFSKLLLLIGGSLTAGSLTGTPQRWWDVTGSVTAGSSTTYNLIAYDSN